MSGCASVMTSDMQTVEVTTSNGKSVTVAIDGNEAQAPGRVQVIRDGREKALRTTEVGCDTETKLEKQVTPIFFGNIIIGGLFGSTTDASTGKMWDYAEKVEINCSK
ncbi:adenosine deaminase [Pseudoalteromonas sp. NBT06-2]|nr:adenosine deaminase [Pseudoalteromonas sp. NBT06-2]